MGVFCLVRKKTTFSQEVESFFHSTEFFKNNTFFYGYFYEFTLTFVSEECRFCQKLGFYMSRRMNAMGPVQSRRHVNFARDPLLSYLDEPQKNEFYFLNDNRDVLISLKSAM